MTTTPEGDMTLEPRDVAPVVRDLASWAGSLLEAVIRCNYRYDKRGALAMLRTLCDELEAALDYDPP